MRLFKKKVRIKYWKEEHILVKVRKIMPLRLWAHGYRGDYYELAWVKK